MNNCIYTTDKFEKRAETCKLITKDIVRSVDVCVIGSGAAGAVLATKLAQAGKSVALLEKGGYYDGESMNQREADMLPLLWQNAAANFTSNLRIAIAQGSCLGGSTVINDAVCFEIPDLVVNQWQAVAGISISKEEWQDAFKEVSKKINVNEVTEDELNVNARKLREACDKFRLHGQPILHRKNWRNCGPSFTNPDLKSCVKCGFCHLGCHYDTKQSMLVTYIHEALKDPNSDYAAYCNCRVDRITYDQGSGLATGVDGTFTDLRGNELYRIRVNAKVVIVSAGAIASSNLLQKSNIGGQKVGKGLALHPAPFVMGVFEEEEIRANRGIPMSYTCHEFGVTNGVENGGFLIESIFLPVFQMALAIPSFGIDHAKMMERLNNYTMAGVMTRDEPAGIITISYNGHPKVVYNLAPKTIDDMARGMAILAKMWFSIGAKSVITSHRDTPEIRTKADIPVLKDAVRNNPDGLMIGSAHPQGGNKMGNNTEECVVDSDCKVYGFENLYVCDASVFPSALGVNPQLTVMALATMTANKIVKNWQDIEDNVNGLKLMDKKKVTAEERPSASDASHSTSRNTATSTLAATPMLTNTPTEKTTTIAAATITTSEESPLGITCHINQPRFCTARAIGDLYAVTSHNSALFSKLENSVDETIVIGKNWKFDSKTLKIYNNLYWKGFFGRDNDALTSALRYFGGFYKRFWKIDDKAMRGITHPFEPQIIDAKSIATEKEVPGYGKVIHLEYQDAPYSSAYDLLKMVDENTIIGKAFLGSFGRGVELFNFSMSRVYDVDFMTEDDLLTIFRSDELSHKPKEEELAGIWEGMLVSDSAITPRSQLFYFNYEDGEVDMRYSFLNILQGRSDVRITDSLFRLDDQTPLYDELRIVTPNLAVGRWVTEWSDEELLRPIIEDFKRYCPIPVSAEAESLLDKISRLSGLRGPRLPRELGLSFLGVEKDEKTGKTRIGLSYLLKKIG
ncbi:MAG: GMC family oxidoreductase [Thermoproteota archaeon]|nr:GMC family oxidoreductase [Thermoproteota archaeon]